MSKYIIIGLMCLFPLEIMAAVHPSVSELIHKYAKTQDEFQPSFISKMETKAVCTYNFPNMKVHANNVERYSTEEFRRDGSRAKIIKKSWGWMNSSRTRDENNKAYNSWLFDGSKFYAYGNGTVNDQFVEGYPGKGSLKGEHEKKHSAQVAWKIVRTEPFLGYFWAEKRVDERILHDKDAYVHNKMQKVGEFQCHVVTAKPEKGVQFKVWIAPEHGYNIAKFECRFGEGYDPIGPGRPYGKGSSTYMAGTIRSFKKIDATWVPMEMDYRENIKYPGGHIQKRRINYKRTEFLINPDHEALGSFLPDDIPNGALIFAHGTRYTWQDGKLIPNKGNVTTDTVDKKIR